MGTEKLIETEVCVIGGGPAGAVIAHRLATMGHDVRLIEKSAFPRQHIGESLPPGILPLLDVIGVREQVERAQFVRPLGATLRWSHQNEHMPAPPVPGFQVDRGQFDHLLLKAAQAAGVKVLQPAHASRPSWCEARGWRVMARAALSAYEIRARFLVDATGRSAVLRGRRIRVSPPTLALCGYWRGVGLSRTDTVVEAGPEEWFWGSPLPDGLFNATVFFDPQRRTEARLTSIDALYREMLSSSRLLRGCLDGDLTRPVIACRASSDYDASCIDTNFIKVGEASFTLDPLSSQGIQAAMQSAVQGSIAAHTLLTCPENAPAAMEFYRERQAEAVTRHADAAADFYAQQRPFRARPFWMKRSGGKIQTGRPDVRPLNPEPLPDGRRLAVAPSVDFHETSIIDRDLIRYAPALTHPSLNRPVAFLDGFEVATLLRDFDDKPTPREVVQRWSHHMSPTKGLEILRWMWSHNLVFSIES